MASDSDWQKVLVEKETRIADLRADLEKQRLRLPICLQNTPVSYLLDQIAPIFQGLSEEPVCKAAQNATGKGKRKAGFMSSMERFLTSGNRFEYSAEEQASEQAAMRMIQDEMMDADQPNYLDEEDMHMFGQRPLVDSLNLVTCNNCQRPVKESHYAQHAERCQMLPANEDEPGQQDYAAAAIAAQKPPRKGRRKPKDSGDLARGTNPEADNNSGAGTGGATAVGVEDPSTLLLPRGKARSIKWAQGGEAPEEGAAACGASAPAGPTSAAAPAPDPTSPRKRSKLSPRMPLTADELDVCCGAVSNHTGAPCRRAITCKYHSEGSKRAVVGRKRPYDVLFQELLAKGGHRGQIQEGASRGLQVQGAPSAVSNARPPRVPRPLASKTYCLRSRHPMRGVITALFREACSNTGRPLPLGAAETPPPGGAPLVSSPMAPNLPQVPPSAMQQPPPVTAAPAPEPKKSKARPKKVGATPGPPQAMDPPPLQSPLPASLPPPEAEGSGPERKPKGKSKPRTPKEPKAPTPGKGVAPSPTLTAATGKAKASNKSIKQQKALQRAQEEMQQRKQEQESLAQQPSPQPPQQQQHMQQAGQAPSPNQHFTPDPLPNLLTRSHSQSQSQQPVPSPRLQLPASHSLGDLGQMEGLQSPGSMMQALTSLGGSPGSQLMEGVKPPQQDADPLQRLFTSGLAQQRIAVPTPAMSFPPPSSGTSADAAMLAGAFSDWGALP